MNGDTTSELRRAIEKFNLAGPHACDCPRSTDTGCTCAMKDEYVDEVMQLIAAQKQRWAIQMLDRLTIQATETKDVKTGAIRQTVGLGFILNEHRALAALDGVIGEQQ